MIVRGGLESWFGLAFERGLVQVLLALGLQRSGPLVTVAAVILAASFAVYATGGVVYLKMIGVGMAAAVLVDAMLIRGVLLPAFTRLAGNANWWAPAWLRPVHQRFWISEMADHTISAANDMGGREAVPSGT